MSACWLDLSPDKMDLVLLDQREQSKDIGGFISTQMLVGVPILCQRRLQFQLLLNSKGASITRSAFCTSVPGTKWQPIKMRIMLPSPADWMMAMVSAGRPGRMWWPTSLVHWFKTSYCSSALKDVLPSCSLPGAI